MTRQRQWVSVFVCFLLIGGLLGCPKKEDNEGEPKKTENKEETTPASTTEGDKNKTPAAEKKPKLALLTDEEVAEILGVNVKESQSSGNAKVISQTTYTGDNNFPVAEIHVVRGPSARQGFDSNNAHKNLESVDGLGEEANWVPVLNNLVIYKKGVYLIVRGVQGTDEVKKSKSIELAKKAVPRA